MRAVLLRLAEDEHQTIGELRLYDGKDLKFQGKTLELPWRDNEKMISRIPEGEYPVRRRRSKKFNDHFHVMDVDNRSLILIHVGNYNHQTHGCILIGQNFVDINNDGHLDVSISRPTLEKLLSVAPDKFFLTIIDLF